MFPISKKDSGVSAWKGRLDGLIQKDDSFTRYVYDLVRVYLDRHISRSAAALSYYLIFTVFPVLIMANAILGLLNLNPDSVFLQLELYLPTDVANLISDYLSYINQNNSLVLLIASVALILTTASAAFRLIVRSCYDIYKIKSSISWVYYVVSCLMPLILVLVIYLSCMIMLTGNWFFRLLERYINLSIQILHWEWMRFLLLFLLLFLFLAMLYRITIPKQTPRPPAMPGALAASVALVIVSVIFSNVMSVSNRYSVVYGSLAALIILMLWLYAIATVLMMGSAYNYILYQHRLAQASGKPLGSL